MQIRIRRKIDRASLLISAAVVALACVGYLSAEEQAGKMPSASATPTPAIPKASALPQATSSPVKKPIVEDDEIIKVDSKLVVVPVSVSDANGALVKNLRVEDFVLREGGKKQEIERLSNPEQVSLDIALLIDVSGSVNKRFPFEKEAAERFLRQVFRAADTITIFTIDEQPVLVQPRTDLGSAINTLKLIEPKRSATAFFDTVAEAAQYFKREAKSGHRRVVVVISDGEDTYSEKYKSAVATITELQQSDTLFYSINPGGPSIRLNQMSRRGQDVMSQMATSTGGVAFVPETDKDLDAAFQQIAAELRSQYLLQYYSADESAKRGFVPITVEILKRPELRIRYRQGYYPLP